MLLLFSIIILLLQQVLIACWQQHVLGAANENCEPPNGLQVPVVGQKKKTEKRQSVGFVECERSQEFFRR